MVLEFVGMRGMEILKDILDEYGILGRFYLQELLEIQFEVLDLNLAFALFMTLTFMHCYLERFRTLTRFISHFFLSRAQARISSILNFKHSQAHKNIHKNRLVNTFSFNSTHLLLLHYFSPVLDCLICHCNFRGSNYQKAR